MEMTEALRYKLRTFFITIDGPADIFYKNQSVVKNLRNPTSTLNRVHDAIFYHWVKEAQADDIIWVVWIEGIRNLYGLFTETLNNPTIQGIISKIFNNSASVVTSDGV